MNYQVIFLLCSRPRPSLVALRYANLRISRYSNAGSAAGTDLTWNEAWLDLASTSKVSAPIAPPHYLGYGRPETTPKDREVSHSAATMCLDCSGSTQRRLSSLIAPTPLSANSLCPSQICPSFLVIGIVISRKLACSILLDNIKMSPASTSRAGRKPWSSSLILLLHLLFTGGWGQVLE